MGASQTRPEYQDLTARSGFSLEQIRNLHHRFQQLSGNKGKISRESLDNLPALADNPVKSQIVAAFFDKRNQDQNEVGYFSEIGFVEFVMVMSHFHPPNTNLTEGQKESVRREKLRFLFNMHDTDNDGIITLAEYRKLVDELLSKSEAFEEETAKDIADAAMLEVASTNVPHMAPDEFYEGITFEHFEQILKGLEMESKMYIRFLDVNTMQCIRSS